MKLEDVLSIINMLEESMKSVMFDETSHERKEYVHEQFEEMREYVKSHFDNI